MLLASLAILIGLIVLVWSADRFVLGAAATARHLGMSPLLIGMTIVSLGTSAPEIFVSATASLDGSGILAIGNALGSNITNVGLVLGITALIAPLPIQGRMLKKEIPILLLVTVIAGLVIQDMHLGFWDGVVMLICLVITLFWLFNETNEQEISGLDEEEVEAIEHTSTAKSIMWLVIGLVALMISAKLLVWGAVEVARYFGISELIIGLTIIAIGTSLPELAASVASALKGHHDIAIGNVVGSNIFNLLAVMPIPGLVAGTDIGSEVLYRDYGAMLAITLLLIAFIYSFRRKGRVGRSAGSILLLAYASYLGLLIFQA
ncbi:calcium/sodium antiporter [Oceaniserpentilla sp. 4NH20-0058]|uniref:calcium/sodium antiporter n=1 Tax=Oceaniserpentilla sp. 4NH20-0058 TaxID=3127660 RepID=UPI0031042C98